MEPRIQYVKASDGMNIPVATSGNGAPFVLMPVLPLSHVSLEWEIDNQRAAIEEMSRFFRLVRYDNRGFGLARRDVDSFELEDLVLDLEAVIDGLELGPVVLFASGASAPVAICYAVRNPNRISRLVLWHAVARGTDAWSDEIRTFAKLGLSNWKLASESIVRALTGWEDPQFAEQTSSVMREAVAPATLLKFIEDSQRWDVTDSLPQLQTRVTVGCRREYPYISPNIARELASSIPRAQLYVAEGSIFWMDGTVMRRLLGGDTSRQAAPPEPAARNAHGTAIIMFADIVDSTALTERIGDAAFRERARTLDDRLRAVIREHAGTAIDGKLLGDGVLATFPAAAGAIAASLAFAAAAEATDLALHVGLHAGDVIREANNVFGGAVNIAARISALSAPGEVLVSRTVADLARTSANVTFDDRGEHALKGIAEPQRVFAVRSAS